MIGLLQRVSSATVAVDGRTVGAIDSGILVFVGIERDDSEARAQRLLDRLLGYRVFAGEDGRMNLSVCDIGAGVLLVPQFTLAADTSRGMRASFTPAAGPELGRHLFGFLVAQACARHRRVQSGQFGADMKVGLVNDGPVTFWLRA
ncbi:MAG: D-aminoacyl-tRNA deacylase [Acidiferrobacterales bacterium]